MRFSFSMRVLKHKAQLTLWFQGNFPAHSPSFIAAPSQYWNRDNCTLLSLPPPWPLSYYLGNLWESHLYVVPVEWRSAASPGLTQVLRCTCWNPHHLYHTSWHHTSSKDLQADPLGQKCVFSRWGPLYPPLPYPLGGIWSSAWGRPSPLYTHGHFS